jgi:ribonuclease Y
VLVAAGIVIGLAVGGVAGVLLVRSIGASRFDKALRTRQQLLEDAEREAEAMRREARVEAREEAVRLRAEIESELQERRSQVARTKSGFRRETRSSSAGSWSCPGVNRASRTARRHRSSCTRT